jgi:signal transduction histidine kinase
VKLTLYQKGLSVILFVLVIQVGFLAIYNEAWNKAEALADRQVRTKAVLGRCNWLAAGLAEVSLSCLAYVTTGDKDCFNIYQRSVPDVQRQFKEFSDLVIENPAQKPTMDRATTLGNNLFSLLDTEAKLGPQSPKDLNDLVKRQMMPVLLELYESRRNILSGELWSFKQDPFEESPVMRKMRIDFLIILLVIDILGAVGLFYWFSRGLTRRLSVLSDNTSRFARREELHQLMRGTDEIADLDAVFHNMVDSLRLAERRKQEFMGMISHDLRTPLSSVQTSLEFVLDGHHGPLSEELRAWIDMANQNVHTVLNLINELLEIERIEGGALNLEYGEVQVSQLIRQAVSSVRAIAEKRNIKIVEADCDAYLEADEDRLLRVLLNLLGNALKFSPTDSTIGIDCRQIDECLEFSVADQGRGIPADFVSKIFDRFQQVSPEDARQLGGSGLGLAISKAIVEAHGGTISVDSVEGKGSTFKFRIPLTRQIGAATPGKERTV